MPRPNPGEAEKAFVSRCMASAESRRSFPDAAQRAAVCHSVWRRRKIHKIACCALCAKADIPEVEAVIRLLDPSIRRELREAGTRVYRELLDRLDAFSDDLGTADVDLLVRAGQKRDDVLGAIVASLLTVVEHGYTGFSSGSIRSKIEDAVDSLFDFGTRVVGFPFEGPRVDLLRQAAERMLDLLVRQTVVDHLGRFRQLFTGFLTTATSREEVSSLSAAAGDSAKDRRAFLFDLEAALVPEASAAASLDAWAYLWAGMSGVEASADAGIRAFEAVATIDGDTTAFCRWVNGRIIPLSSVRAQIDSIVNASLAGDGAALRKAWPFLSPDIARHGNELQFERFFRRVGLPPYHFGCRTQPRPIRLGR